MVGPGQDGDLAVAGEAAGVTVERLLVGPGGGPGEAARPIGGDEGLDVEAAAEGDEVPGRPGHIDPGEERRRRLLHPKTRTTSPRSRQRRTSEGPV